MKQRPQSIDFRAVFSTVFVFCTFGAVASAAALPHPEHLTHKSSQQTTSLQARDTVCGIPGNPDIYGLGIRLGLYLLWVATIFTYECLQDEISNAIDANLIFFFSISIATFVLSTQSPKPYAEEIYILLVLFFGGFVSLAFPSKLGSFSVFGFAIRLYLFAGMASYAIWFWFGGMDGFRQQPCGSQAFLFAKVALFGHARTFFKIVSVVSLVVPTGLMFFMEIGLCMPGVILFSLSIICALPVALLVGLEKLFKRKAATKKKVSGQISDHTKTWQGLASFFAVYTRPIVGKSKHDDKSKSIPSLKETRKSKPLWRQYPLWNVAVLIWTVICIEMTLVWNQVKDVHSISSTGQLIPFVTGIAGILKVMYVWIGQSIEKSKYNTGLGSGGEHTDNAVPANQAEELIELTTQEARARRHSF